mmetsp:Transcript_9479/g.17729  ORF Transcript_9479/g.17729 Transcript_9479/m.17729 type:complete len:174 (-) Transcript_9479:1845-2366(-)
MVASSSKLTSKVKKLVLADQRIGKVAKKSFNALGIATELFACQLFKSMSDLACDYEPNPRILKAEHLKCVAKGDGKLAFLLSLPALENAPDFVAEEKVVRDKPLKRKNKAGATSKAKKRATAGTRGASKQASSSSKDKNKKRQEAKESVNVEASRSAQMAQADLSEDDDYDVE